MVNLLRNVFGTFAPDTRQFGEMGLTYDPRAAQKAAVGGVLKGLGVGLASQDWGRAAEIAGSGVEDYQAQQARKAQMQDLMFRADENRRKREEEAKRTQQMEEAISQLPADQQALARMMPEKFFGNQIDAQFSPGLAPNDRYKAVGNNLYDVETGQWVQGPDGQGQGDLPKGYRWNQDGTGAEPIPGVSLPGTQMRLTEQQSKDLVYLQRGESALKNLDANEAALTGFKDNAFDYFPFGNYATSKEYQVASQAGREFLAAVLRKDTGAAITAQEMDVYGRMYLPQPGDSKEVLAQKKQARRVALDAIKNGLGAARSALPESGPITTEDGYTIEPVE